MYLLLLFFMKIKNRILDFHKNKTQERSAANVRPWNALEGVIWE